MGLSSAPWWTSEISSFDEGAMSWRMRSFLGGETVCRFPRSRDSDAAGRNGEKTCRQVRGRGGLLVGNGRGATAVGGARGRWAETWSWEPPGALEGVRDVDQSFRGDAFMVFMAYFLSSSGALHPQTCCFWKPLDLGRHSLKVKAWTREHTPEEGPAGRSVRPVPPAA